MQIEPAVAVVIAERRAEADPPVACIQRRAPLHRRLHEAALALVHEQPVPHSADRGDEQIEIAVVVDIAPGRAVGRLAEALQPPGARHIVECPVAAVAQQQVVVVEPRDHQIDVAVAVEIARRRPAGHPLRIAERAPRFALDVVEHALARRAHRVLHEIEPGPLGHLHEPRGRLGRCGRRAAVERQREADRHNHGEGGGGNRH